MVLHYREAMGVLAGQVDQTESLQFMQALSMSLTAGTRR